MKTIILDTNFLTIPFQFKLDIFDQINKLMEEEFEIVVLDGTVKELQKLSQSKSEDATAAKIGLDLIKRKNLKIIGTNQDNVDSTIVRLADENTIVATNDKELRQKLKLKNVKVMYLRGKNRLDLG